MEWLNDIYLQQVGFPAEPGPDNDLLREALQKHIADLKPAAVSAFFNGKPYVAAEIADLASHRPLFRQPAVLLAYYLVVRIPNQLRACWPFPADELQPIYDCLGIAMRNL